MKLSENENIVITKAKSLEFICHYQEPDYWLIFPKQSNQRWKLQQVRDRWILSVGDVPQIRLYSKEAMQRDLGRGVRVLP